MKNEWIVTRDEWSDLRINTEARIALGRAGAGLPTSAWLDFRLAHARARDAVHTPLAAEQIQADLQTGQGRESFLATSQCEDRYTYLTRPDLGRRLSAQSLEQLKGSAGTDSPIVYVVADGLSPEAPERYAPAVLRELEPGPVVVVRMGRVAIGDEIGELFRARMVAVLIGERPGLSAAHSLGAYITYEPRVGRTDAQRFCVSNIRDGGLTPGEAAAQIRRILLVCREQGFSGVSNSPVAPLVKSPD